MQVGSAKDANFLYSYSIGHHQLSRTMELTADTLRDEQLLVVLLFKGEGKKKKTKTEEQIVGWEKNSGNASIYQLLWWTHKQSKSLQIVSMGPLEVKTHSFLHSWTLLALFLMPLRPRCLFLLGSIPCPQVSCVPHHDPLPYPLKICASSQLPGLWHRDPSASQPWVPAQVQPQAVSGTGRLPLLH